MTLDHSNDAKRALDRKTFLKASAAAGVVLGAGNMGRALAETPSATRSAAGVTQIKFWDMLWGPSPQYINTAKQLVAKFNASQSAIQVSYQLIPWANW
jgi:ABC-type glycerol-3-phosphate transport system substrate-binding protein